MSWTRIDDQLHGHHKIKRAWKSRPALGLHLMALSYSACYDLKGRVPLEFVEEKLPNGRERVGAVKALLDAGIWEDHDNGRDWQIHDWDEYNGTAKTREEMRAAKSAAGKKGAAARWGDGKPMAACHGSANGTGMAPSPSPSQTTPPDPQGGIPDVAPSKPTGNRQRDLDKFSEDMAAWAAHHFPGADPRAVESTIVWSRLEAPVTAEALRSRAMNNELWAGQLGLESKGAA